VPDCYLSCAIDVGESNNVHPSNKREVGRRLALVALANSYGEKVDCTGPTYASMAVEGSNIRLRFEHAQKLASSDGQPLKQFYVAGDDRKLVSADAKVDGDDVIVSSPAVPHPVAARYAWVNDPAGCNLTNSTGLPALPFRTDDWPISSEARP
jgi:sialate O-acetylesterase